MKICLALIVENSYLFCDNVQGVMIFSTKCCRMYYDFVCDTAHKIQEVLMINCCHTQFLGLSKSMHWNILRMSKKDTANSEVGILYKILQFSCIFKSWHFVWNCKKLLKIVKKKVLLYCIFSTYIHYIQYNCTVYYVHTYWTYMNVFWFTLQYSDSIILSSVYQNTMSVESVWAHQNSSWIKKILIQS